MIKKEMRIKREIKKIWRDLTGEDTGPNKKRLMV